MKQNYYVLLLALISFLVVPTLIAQDESVLSDIHKRLSTPGYESRHDQNRMVFVGEIIALGAVFHGVCKQPVNQNIDFRVSEILVGDPPEPTVRAGYINCTGEPLPSPPFTLHAKVLVYCFHNAGFKCLVPVTFGNDRLKRVKSWIAESSAADHSVPP
jgi:hypothetical protein